LSLLVSARLLPFPRVFVPVSIMPRVQVLASDAAFGPAVQAAGDRLIVMDMFATWYRYPPPFPALLLPPPTSPPSASSPTLSLPLRYPPLVRSAIYPASVAEVAGNLAVRFTRHSLTTPLLPPRIFPGLELSFFVAAVDFLVAAFLCCGISY